MKLYLDDVRTCPIGWHMARTIQEAKDEVLKAKDLYQVWEKASLDHDLGACHECFTVNEFVGIMPHCKHVGDGRDFVQWMIDTNNWPEDKPTVHSMNPEGRKTMQQMIDKYGPY